ncbi:MAG: class I SAM-dependent methyltransferase [Candidatus Helarchaeota archaeon]
MIYRILKCQNCGFIWQNQILNDEFQKELYNNWIDIDESFKKKQNNKLLNDIFFHEQLIIKSFFPNLSNKQINILDYGAGWGFFCNFLRGFNFNIYGLEFSAYKKDFMSKKLNLKILNLEDLNKYKFHYINLDQVFEHVERPMKLLLDLKNVLNRLGVIHISVPNGRNIENLINKGKFKVGKNPLHPLEHINCFTPSSLIKLAKLLNLKRISPKFRPKIFLKYPYNSLKLIYSNIFYRKIPTLSIFFQKSK